MLRLAALLSLLAGPALAGEPSTIILPSSLVVAIGDYLRTKPYSEVSNIIDAMKECVQVQIPNAQGAIVSHGQCPVVTAAMQPKTSPETQSSPAKDGHSTP